MGDGFGRGIQYRSFVDWGMIKMRYSIAYEINRYRIYDKRKRTVGWIRRPVLAGNWLEVYDADGKKRFGVIRQKGEIWLEGAGEDSQHCAMEYAEDENGMGIQKSVLRPPMAEWIAVHTQMGELAVCQKTDRRFSIWMNQRKVGEMTHMQWLVKSIYLSENLPKEYCGLCFAIGFLMLHEDDVWMV